MSGNCTKRLELGNHRFGKLTAVSRAENIGRDTAWLCRCDCGKEVVVRTSYLRRGKKTDCGCESRKSPPGETAGSDLSGVRFGKLTVLGPLDKATGMKYKWRCVCDCGSECIVSAGNLRNGHTRSCGCNNKGPKVHNVDGTCVELLRSNKLRRNNTSGAVGVELVHRRYWRATICFKGKRYYLGLFDRYEDAVQARREAEARYFGTFLAEYDAGKYGEEQEM